MAFPACVPAWSLMSLSIKTTVFRVLPEHKNHSLHSHPITSHLLASSTSLLGPLAILALFLCLRLEGQSSPDKVGAQ